jgi:C1A family cysteine protease
MTDRHKVGKWIPDLPDIRDYKYQIPEHVDINALPPSVDLRDRCPSVYNQGALGSCTSMAIAAAVEFDLLKQGLPDFTPSRLFIYYNERAMEGTVSSDAGAAIRDGIKSINKQGVCDESIWIYDVSKFTVKPDDTAYREALDNVSLSYRRVPRDLIQMKSVLVSGYPFVAGFTVYSYFESQSMATEGILRLPLESEEVLGGHAILVVGFDNSKNSFIIRNSWGKNWGLEGYFYMDYNYLLNKNLSDDFWLINNIK